MARKSFNDFVQNKTELKLAEALAPLGDATEQLLNEFLYIARKANSPEAIVEGWWGNLKSRVAGAWDAVANPWTQKFTQNSEKGGSNAREFHWRTQGIRNALEQIDALKKTLVGQAGFKPEEVETMLQGLTTRVNQGMEAFEKGFKTQRTPQTDPLYSQGGQQQAAPSPVPQKQDAPAQGPAKEATPIGAKMQFGPGSTAPAAVGGDTDTMMKGMGFGDYAKWKTGNDDQPPAPPQPPAGTPQDQPPEPQPPAAAPEVVPNPGQQPTPVKQGRGAKLIPNRSRYPRS